MTWNDEFQWERQTDRDRDRDRQTERESVLPFHSHMLFTTKNEPSDHYVCCVCLL